MGFLFDKQKKGRLYTYWGESARVKGKPRLIEQIYLGPKERVLEEIKCAYTRGQAPGPTPLRQLDHLEFGASAWLWSWIERLGLIELIDVARGYEAYMRAMSQIDGSVQMAIEQVGGRG